MNWYFASVSTEFQPKPPGCSHVAPPPTEIAKLGKMVFAHSPPTSSSCTPSEFFGSQVTKGNVSSSVTPGSSIACVEGKMRAPQTA